MSAKATVDNCKKCGKRELVSPLHGEKGGPLFCIPCGMEWHGEYGRRRRWGRIVIKAMKGYEKAGGHLFSRDFNKLKFAASNMSWGGYEAEPDTVGAETGDITLELLNDTLQLVHPDHQPPERRELAHRVTQELNALRPFVFPAPKPEPTPEAASRGTSVKSHDDNLNEVLRKEFTYPCEDCTETTSYYYCAACKTEYEKREHETDEQRRAKQREWYQRRKAWRWQTSATCVVCKKDLKKRTDAECCSAACRQKLYRQRKTGAATKSPSQRQLRWRQERERKARIKLKWKRIWSLPRGAKVIVNGSGHGKYPQGTRLEVKGWMGWKISLAPEDQHGGWRDFSSRDIDAFDIVPENEATKLSKAS